MSSIVNITLYQAGWLGAVLAAGAGSPGLAALLALIPAALHIGLVPDRARELQLLGFAGLLGLVIDTVTVQAGILRFPAQLGLPGLAPLWIVAIWVQFGMTFHYSFGWLSGRYGLGALLGFVGGPLSFLAGARLGAVEIAAPTAVSLALLGLVWSVALPLLVAIADRLTPRRGSQGLYRFELGKEPGSFPAPAADDTR